MNIMWRVILICIVVLYTEVEAGGSCSKLENKIADNLLDMLVTIKSGSTKPGGDSGKNRPAFTATLGTTKVTYIGPSAIVKFNNVVLNRGGGYEPTTGKFTAPKSGLYQFSFTIMSYSGGELNMAVVKNRSMIMSLYGPKIHGATETANPVLELKEGDTVFMQHLASNSQTMYGNHYSHFSGYYIGE
ncbi:unnamed protein product [Mytilus coruscus]|uniref:C1q domain-containing protein n=1 Tax=Mytilus coruscus TaxID=42192 RepID=A0A6J8EQS1_MYTCO|nr:unnamed protein product [Mytilus coruscus]